MQLGENDREQDPVYGQGGEQPPRAAAQPPPGNDAAELPQPHAASQQPPLPIQQPSPASQQPPAASQQPPAASKQPPAASQPPDAARQQTDAARQQTDAIWFGGQVQHSSHTADQPPPYPANWAASGGGWPPQPGGTGGPWGPPPQRQPGHARRIVSFVLVALLGVAIGAVTAFGLTHRGSQPTSSPGASAVPGPGSSGPPLRNTNNSKINPQAVNNVVAPSIVDITSKLPYQNETAQGTGIVISSKGLVLTNNHVIAGATQVTGQIDGAGRTYSARVIGTDKTDDVALLQLEGASGLKPASMGDSSKVAIGDPVVAIGNLGGQNGAPTVTVGTITALNRTITAGDQGIQNPETLHGVLQTDASIGSGDSGGALVNSRGQVIGMNTAAASNNFGQSQSIGFAIPINNALAIAREIAAGHGSGKIQIGLPGFLGVNVCDISRAAECMSNGVNFGGFGNTSIAPVNSGALVAGVVSGTPAESAGISAGDVITGLDGASITSAQSLTNNMKSHRPGDKVSVTWVDTHGQRHTASLTLMTGPAA